MRAFFSSKKFIISAGIAVVIIAVIIFSLNSGNGKQAATVIRADIVQEVASTGKVEPNQDVDLGFNKSGRVAAVYAYVGDIVKAGQTIAALEAGETSADLAKARAFLEEEEVKLREIRNTAPVSFGDASKNLDAALREGFADADNAVRNRADQFFENTATNPLFEVSFTNVNFVHYFDVPTDMAIDINNDRKKVEDILTEWQNRISGMNSVDLITEADRAISNLNTISVFLDKMAGAVNAFSPAEYAYETTVSNYKTTISSARSEVSGAISAIVTAKDKFNAVRTLGGGEFGDVLTQEAKVRQAQAAVASLEALLGQSIIRAPFEGVITLQEAKVGGAVSAGTTLVSLISETAMYVEANISEINIGKVAVGNPTSVTFDALPGEEFLGKVSYIEPGDVIIDGVVNYKIRVSLDNQDPRIKSGLTANLKIQTAKKESVLAVPLYAVVKENGQNFVNKIEGGAVQKIPITVGLSGSNGMAEVVEGLGEWDVIQY